MANPFVEICAQQWLGEFALQVPPVTLQGIALDSREVINGGCFVAVQGHQLDGRTFIDNAVAKGARLVLCETKDASTHGRVNDINGVIMVDFYQLPAHLSALASAFFQQPSKQFISIAVTGTNGKTSVVNMVAQLLTHQDHTCGVMGTLGNGIFSDDFAFTESKNTTPDAVHIQSLLHQWQQSGVTHVAYEASSHALVQGRISAVHTDIAVFTNLTRDHLDYHGSMQAYAEAKRRLLQQPGLKSLVLNADDPESAEWAKRAQHLQIVWTGCQADLSEAVMFCRAEDIQFDQQGCSFVLSSSWGRRQISMPLLGEFNVSNLLAAFAAVMLLGGDFHQVVAAVNQLRAVPGRMERFGSKKGNLASVIVDYAHTPDALQKALTSARLHTKGKLWCVFGCGGERDAGKRPMMGQMAEALADEVVITTDNARSESPRQIADDIRAGMMHPESALDIPQRESAITYCLTHAHPNDLILVAGKGHETYQIIEQQTVAYDERATVCRLIEEFSQ